LSAVLGSSAVPFVGVCDARLISCKMSGLRVTIPVPRGRLGGVLVDVASDTSQATSTHKSRPTMFSSTELFPLDCDPTTAICGRSIGFWTYVRH
jgi:hypothetical protein